MRQTLDPGQQSHSCPTTCPSFLISWQAKNSTFPRSKEIKNDEALCYVLSASCKFNIRFEVAKRFAIEKDCSSFAKNENESCPKFQAGLRGAGPTQTGGWMDGRTDRQRDRQTDRGTDTLCGRTARATKNAKQESQQIIFHFGSNVHKFLSNLCLLWTLEQKLISIPGACSVKNEAERFWHWTTCHNRKKGKIFGIEKRRSQMESSSSFSSQCRRKEDLCSIDHQELYLHKL